MGEFAAGAAQGLSEGTKFLGPNISGRLDREQRAEEQKGQQTIAEGQLGIQKTLADLTGQRFRDIEKPKAAAEIDYTRQAAADFARKHNFNVSQALAAYEQKKEDQAIMRQELQLRESISKSSNEFQLSLEKLRNQNLSDSDARQFSTQRALSVLRQDHEIARDKLANEFRKTAGDEDLVRQFTLEAAKQEPGAFMTEAILRAMDARLQTAKPGEVGAIAEDTYDAIRRMGQDRSIQLLSSIAEVTDSETIKGLLTRMVESGTNGKQKTFAEILNSYDPTGNKPHPIPSRGKGYKPILGVSPQGMALEALLNKVL